MGMVGNWMAARLKLSSVGDMPSVGVMGSDMLGFGDSCRPMRLDDSVDGRSGLQLMLGECMPNAPATSRFWESSDLAPKLPRTGLPSVSVLGANLKASCTQPAKLVTSSTGMSQERLAKSPCIHIQKLTIVKGCTGVGYWAFKVWRGRSKLSSIHKCLGYGMIRENGGCGRGRRAYRHREGEVRCRGEAAL